MAKAKAYPAHLVQLQPPVDNYGVLAFRSDGSVWAGKFHIDSKGKAMLSWIEVEEKDEPKTS